MRILIIDDHNLFSSGIKYVLKSFDESIDVIAASSCADGLEIAQSGEFDLILLDLFLPDSFGISALERILDSLPLCPVVIVSAYMETNLIQKAIETGAMGFISKESGPEEMYNAIKLVLDGGSYIPKEFILAKHDIVKRISPPENLIKEIVKDFKLTPRQKNVIEQVAKFKSNKEISMLLGCAESTVKIHVRSAFRTIGVKNRSEFYYMIHGKRIIAV